MTPNGPSMTPQDTVEQALAAARTGGECVVIADESSTANLRWAGNTLTTNGVAATRSLTVIAIDRRGRHRPPLRDHRRPGRRPRPGGGEGGRAGVGSRGRGGAYFGRRHGPFD